MNCYVEQSFAVNLILVWWIEIFGLKVMVEPPGKKTYSPHTHTHAHLSVTLFWEVWEQHLCSFFHIWQGPMKATSLARWLWVLIVIFFNEIKMNLGNLNRKPISHRDLIIHFFCKDVCSNRRNTTYTWIWVIATWVGLFLGNELVIFEPLFSLVFFC